MIEYRQRISEDKKNESRNKNKKQQAKSSHKKEENRAGGNENCLTVMEAHKLF